MILLKGNKGQRNFLSLKINPLDHTLSKGYHAVMLRFHAGKD